MRSECAVCEAARKGAEAGTGGLCADTGSPRSRDGGLWKEEMKTPEQCTSRVKPLATLGENEG